ncbi:hypothetical protein ACFU98_45200 [Streptomyces sp. NPDC057575]|uniref:hypothetical protein n=1 Tax=unclassified Streptomyces TaxID=2593676 RepID=UPI0036A70D21
MKRRTREDAAKTGQGRADGVLVEVRSEVVVEGSDRYVHREQLEGPGRRIGDLGPAPLAEREILLGESDDRRLRCERFPGPVLVRVRDEHRDGAGTGERAARPQLRHFLEIDGEQVLHERPVVPWPGPLVDTGRRASCPPDGSGRPGMPALLDEVDPGLLLTGAGAGLDEFGYPAAALGPVFRSHAQNLPRDRDPAHPWNPVSSDLP